MTRYYHFAPILIILLALINTSPVHAASLRAVIVVGPIDGETGGWTLEQVGYARSTAATLRSHGVEVTEFYPPNDDWEAIKDASRTTQFWVYYGHGVDWGDQVGGLSLTNRLVHPSLLGDLNLAPGAVVMLYACYAAGGSGDEVIDRQTALRRVTQYARPFVSASATVYADWHGEAFATFVNDLFGGMTFEGAYRA